MSKHEKEKESDSVWFRTLLIIVIIVWVAIALGNLAGNYLAKSKFFGKKAEAVNTAAPGITINTPAYEAPKDYGTSGEGVKASTVTEEKDGAEKDKKINEENKEKPKEEVKKEETKVEKTSVVKKPEPKKSEVKTEEKGSYKLQAGFYSDKDNAYKAASQIKSLGFNAYVVDLKSGYKVFVGSYKSKENAEKGKEQLKAKGVDVMIVGQ